MNDSGKEKEGRYLYTYMYMYIGGANYLIKAAKII